MDDMSGPILAGTWRSVMTLGAAAVLALSGGAIPAAWAQAVPVQTVDPDAAIDGDLVKTPATAPAAGPSAPAAMPTSVHQPVAPAPAPADSAVAPGFGEAGPAAASSGQPAPGGATYREDDLIGAAEGVFGKGAQGLANLIQDILKKQGEPNAYIVGREGGAALVVGLRYGSGTLYHKVEGQKPVYWTGPSVGFDAGANAGNTFVLVYNLYNSDDLYRRFGAGEGQAYLVGGFHVSYMRRGDVVLIPVRAGVGLRLGVNAGYMKFSRKQRWLPF